MDLAKTTRVSAVKNCLGTATTEFLVSMAFFVPIFTAVPMVGKYLDFKQKNIDSTRYAVWERTVWADPQGPWNENENTKTDDVIGTEVDSRIYGSQMQGMANKKITDNKLWVDRNGKKILTLAPKGKKRITVTVGEDVSPSKNSPADAFAYKGVPLVGKTLSKFTGLINSTLGKVIPGCKDFPGIDFDKGMNLGSKTYSPVTVSATIINFLPTTDNPDPKNAKLTFRSSGSILSNAWTAPTEAKYKERSGKLVLDEAVRCIAEPAKLISFVPFYKEGKDAKNVVQPADTSVLLSTYKK